MKILGINEGDDLPEMKIIGDDKKLYGGAEELYFFQKNMLGMASMGFSPFTFDYVNS